MDVVESAVLRMFMRGAAELDNLTDSDIARLSAVVGQADDPRAVIDAITYLLERGRDMERLLLTDMLTGLKNRTGFMQDLVNRVAYTKRHTDSSTAVVFVDLDGFKQINDECGHEIGDRALKDIGERLSQNFRRTDTIARIGGDELALLLLPARDGRDNGPKDGAPKDSDWVRRRVRACTRDMVYWDKSGNAYPLGASIGVVMLDVCQIGMLGSIDTEDLAGKVLKMADEDMYEDKRTGKNDRLAAAHFEAQMMHFPCGAEGWG